jgi:hypothetical protein
MENIKMRLPTTKTNILMIGMIVIIQACSVISPTSVLPTAQPVTETPVTSVAEPAGGLDNLPATESVIQHTSLPVNLPMERYGRASDFDSSKVSGKRPTIGGDRFTYGQFERPFNANAMDVYFSQLDIVNTLVYQDETWIYAILTLKELNAGSSRNEKYAVELDIDLNGKGDWFIMSYKPESTDWTVSGVKVYQDANQDVGGEIATLADKNLHGGDGFETLVFDNGQGDDPDTAWARISPNDPNTIEFAIKKSVLSNPAQFLINMWAGTSLLDPMLFDINDHFTHEQAGAADPGFEFYYPIIEVAEIDNSCRIAVGFQPTGKEPGLCKTLIPAAPDSPYVPELPPAASCPPCQLPEEYQIPPDCTCYIP